jgi:chromosome segregation ATPase
MADGTPERTTTESLQERLQTDEEWLKDLNENLTKSTQLSTNINSMLDTFQERLDGLTKNIAPLCEKTSAIQKKRQNMKKLLNIIQATIQFYGKTMEFENAVRDGDPSLNLEEFLEKMDSLREAIAFFSSQPTYRGQLENMVRFLGKVMTKKV